MHVDTLRCVQLKINYVELLQGLESPEQYNVQSYFEVRLQLLKTGANAWPRRFADVSWTAYCIWELLSLRVSCLMCCICKLHTWAAAILAECGMPIVISPCSSSETDPVFSRNLILQVVLG